MKRKIKKFVLYFILILYTLISIYPLVWMILYSFKDNNEIFVTNPFGLPHVWRFENYRNAVERFDVMTYLKNSVVVALLTILLVEFLALLFCYVIARVQNRVTRFFNLLISSGMFIPIQAIMIPLVIIVRRFGFTNSLWSVIVPYTAVGLPFACMLFYGFYLGLPIELEESAFMDGANLGTIYFKIILPQMKSPIVVLVIYQFMACWNEFNLALILLTQNALKTLPLGLVNFWTAYQAQWGEVGAAMIMASIPVLIIYLFFSNQIADAMSASGMKN
ncbi:MAG: carbohydrate ABC transporter permease [Lachnospiraceae bacterium]|jgi:raffinose/stachyose/melibiose transport system permease protein|nr:carbohydrate ABC transporter permease [Lachnospiraceae bacterium]MCI9013494.1 carbohydrate ABC transporter permease [Lachnospiraceae bacterium]MCI9254615.1 carbohydrate ABC transporter permease [Lachnospiraceae bacterium]